MALDFTKTQLDAMTEEDFAARVLQQHLDSVSPGSPVAAKLRKAIKVLHQDDLDKHIRQANWWELCFFDKHGNRVNYCDVGDGVKDKVIDLIRKSYSCGSWFASNQN